MRPRIEALQADLRLRAEENRFVVSCGSLVSVLHPLHSSGELN